MMAEACRKKTYSMARDVAGPIFLRSFIGLTLQAARGALQSLSSIPTLRIVEDGGIGLFSIFQERSRSYLQARATRNQESCHLLAFNAGMIMAKWDIGDPVLRLD